MEKSNAASTSRAVFVNYSVIEMGFNDDSKIMIVFKIEDNYFFFA